MAVEAPPGRMEQARAGMRRAALKRQVEAVAAGSGDRLPIDLEDGSFDVATVVAEVAWPLQPQSASLTRLVVALHRSGVADAVVAGLAEDDPLQLERCCRILGALRLEPAVPWLAPLLRSEHVAVSDRAARALGRIGGIRSAEALLAATRRAGTRRTLVVALARAAPDLFIETVLSSRRRPGLLGAAALAAGLRRRHTAVGPLLALLDSGTRRHRAISCRALGWMRAGTAIPALTSALSDPDWRVRMAAAKALGELHAQAQFKELDLLLTDRDPRVRKAAKQSLLRLGNVMLSRDWRWAWR